MSAVDHLRSVGRGETPGDDGLLENVRCGWGRGEVVGHESILAAFCARPFAESDGLAVETAQGAAMIGEEDALIADVYNGRIGRMWRVGRGVAFPDEPAIDVAFDPDMRQQRGAMLFRAEDHPELSSEAAEGILAAAREHLEQLRRAGGLRVRAFVVRAFGSGESSAALLAVYSMSNEVSRRIGFSHTVVGIGRGGNRVISEHSQPRPWNPRL